MQYSLKVNSGEGVSGGGRTNCPPSLNIIGRMDAFA